jgi:hypothetical protein
VWSRDGEVRHGLEARRAAGARTERTAVSERGLSYEDPAPRSRAGTYAAVLVLEAIVILALWWFSRHFSA